MSDLERIKERILDKYLRERVVIDQNEYRKLTPNEKKFCAFFAGDYEYDARFDIPPEDLDSFLALKSFEAQMVTMNAIITIKNIVVFIFVLSIIASIVLFFLQVQRF